jgi:hypothetical protein
MIIFGPFWTFVLPLVPFLLLFRRRHPCLDKRGGRAWPRTALAPSAADVLPVIIGLNALDHCSIAQAYGDRAAAPESARRRHRHGPGGFVGTKDGAIAADNLRSSICAPAGRQSPLPAP